MLKELPPDHDLGHLRTALTFVKDFRVAIDGGAHQGIWTRELLKHFDTVYAFEPVPSNFEKLPEESINRNNALGDGSFVVAMANGPENTGQYHINPRSSVCGMTLLNALDSEMIDDVDFLKLDVEGYELMALKGASETIMRCKPVILIEENGLCERYGVKPFESEEYLISLGYKRVAKRNKDYIYEYNVQ